jgi:DNA invertase Pin-like site-specific DNA recombinase
MLYHSIIELCESKRPLARQEQERQREGVAKAKAAGKYRGRRPTANAVSQEVVRLAGKRMTKTAIAGQLNIGEATVYRILAAASKQKP